jgi:hypothetical protein
MRIKHITTAFLVIIHNIIGQAQVIKGTVLDELTHSEIKSAIVFFNGTSAGTYTDDNGKFELKLPTNNSLPLTINALGYNSVTIENIDILKSYLVYLKPKVHELNEVIINARLTAKEKIERRTNLRIFKEQFLGKTMNALRSEILNVNEIVLVNKNDTLIAYCTKPIIVDNKALGYRISYYLNRFSYCKKTNSMFLHGNCFFSEYTTKNMKRFEQRRRTTYLGSRMHLFRSLWENSLHMEGFSIMDTLNNKLSYDDLVVQTDSLSGSEYLKSFNKPGKVFVSYYSKLPKSFIIVTEDNVYFFRHDVMDPLKIIWGGEISNQRIGDILPFEYGLNNN